MGDRAKFIRAATTDRPVWNLISDPSIAVVKIGNGVYRVEAGGELVSQMPEKTLDDAMALAVAVGREGYEIWKAGREVERRQVAAGDRRAELRAAEAALDKAALRLEKLRAARLHAQLRGWYDSGQATPGMTREDLRRLTEYGEPGTRLWHLPAYTDGGYQGRGQAVTAAGLVSGMAGYCVLYETAGHDLRRGGPMTVMPLDAARLCWWVLTPDGGALVAGGWDDRERTRQVRDERYPDHQLVQGRDFMPED